MSTSNSIEITQSDQVQSIKKFDGLRGWINEVRLFRVQHLIKLHLLVLSNKYFEVSIDWTMKCNDFSTNQI